MAYNQNLQITGIAGGALNINRFVKQGSTATDGRDGNVVIAAVDAAAPIIGIVVSTNPLSGASTQIQWNTPAAAGDDVAYANVPGQQVYLVVNGAGSNIAPGDMLTATTAGVGVKTTTDGDFVGAIAAAPATTDGATIPVTIANFTFTA